MPSPCHIHSTVQVQKQTCSWDLERFLPNYEAHGDSELQLWLQLGMGMPSENWVPRYLEWEQKASWCYLRLKLTFLTSNTKIRKNWRGLTQAGQDSKDMRKIGDVCQRVCWVPNWNLIHSHQAKENKGSKYFGVMTKVKSFLTTWSKCEGNIFSKNIFFSFFKVCGLIMGTFQFHIQQVW